MRGFRVSGFLLPVPERDGKFRNADPADLASNGCLSRPNGNPHTCKYPLISAVCGAFDAELTNSRGGGVIGRRKKMPGGANVVVKILLLEDVLLGGYGHRLNSKFKGICI